MVIELLIYTICFINNEIVHINCRDATDNYLYYLVLNILLENCL